MTDYPSIKPEDVREGDVVRGIYTCNYGQRIAVEGEVISKGSRLRIGAFLIRADLTDLRLVSRTDWRVGDRCVRRDGAGPVETVGCVFPFTTVSGAVIDGAAGAVYRNVDIGEYVPVFDAPTPPEPPLRVGDWVRDDHGCTWQIANEYGPTNCHGRTRIEPPVGWPVGVPDPDAPGGVRWYTRTFMGDKYHRHHAAEKKAVFDIGWTDLVAAGGVPALAVTR